MCAFMTLTLCNKMNSLQHQSAKNLYSENIVQQIRQMMTCVELRNRTESDRQNYAQKKSIHGNKKERRVMEYSLISHQTIN